VYSEKTSAGAGEAPTLEESHRVRVSHVPCSICATMSSYSTPDHTVLVEVYSKLEERGMGSSTLSTLNRIRVAMAIINQRFF
jgi:hypothetical protein